MVFERRRPAAASLTLSCPGLSPIDLSEAAGQYQPACPASDWPLSRLGTGPAAAGQSSGSTPPTSSKERGCSEPRSTARVTSDLPPCLDTSMHKGVAQRRSLEYVAMKGGKTAADCSKQLVVSVYVRGRHGDLVSDCRTTGPSLDPHSHLLPQMCSSGLFVGGPGGRNYTRDDPVLPSPPAFQVQFSFVG